MSNVPQNKAGTANEPTRMTPGLRPHRCAVGEKRALTGSLQTPVVRAPNLHPFLQLQELFSCPAAAGGCAVRSLVVGSESQLTVPETQRSV